MGGNDGYGAVCLSERVASCGRLGINRLGFAFGIAQGLSAAGETMIHTTATTP